MKPEEILHASVADYLNLALQAPDWWTTFPAGGGGKVRGALLKRLGLKAGVSDILILKREGSMQNPRVIWIELKVGRNKLSPQQVVTGDALLSAGCFTYECRSIADVESVLIRHGIKLRARAA